LRNTDRALLVIPPTAFARATGVEQSTDKRAA
jgi:hypothetical protein